ncbi:MAG: LemA family protein [Oligoflexia bacterium]|nr:LemA family protein [Oligoflexia bacterium]
MKKSLTGIIVVGLIIFISGCGYNKIQGLDEEVKAAWSEIQNQYQRRFDLIPNLVKTVKAYAKHERDTLEAVVKARSQISQIKVGSDVVNNPEQFKKFQSAQGELSSALSRLMVVVERYPDLKANQNFRDLQVQLEGTENRIAVARGRYINVVKEYNKAVRFFPTNLTAKYLLRVDVKPNFELENESVKEVPKVDFN